MFLSENSVDSVKSFLDRLFIRHFVNVFDGDSVIDLKAWIDAQ